DGNPHSVQAHTPVELVDNEPLEEVVELFRVGSMNLGWDPTMSQVVLEAYAFPDADVEEELPQQEPESEELLRVRMPVGMARAFAKRPKKSWPQVVQFVPTVVTQLIPTDTPAPGPNCNVGLRTAHRRAGTHRSYHHGLQCNILWEHRRYKRRL